MNNIESLANETNQKISRCQTTVQRFGRWMNGRFFAKGNKDKRIPESCRDGEEDVYYCEMNRLLLQSTIQRGRIYQFLNGKKYFIVLQPPFGAKIYLSIICFSKLKVFTVRFRKLFVSRNSNFGGKIYVGIFAPNGRHCLSIHLHFAEQLLNT